MRDLSLGLTLLMVALAGIPVAVIAYLNRKQSTATGWYLLLCASNTLWAILAAMVYIVTDEYTAFIFQNIKLAFIGTSSIILYIILLLILKNRSLDKHILGYMFSIPLLTFVLGLTDHKHGVLIRSVDFIYEDGVRIAMVVNGPWFWIHSILCYIMVAKTVYLIIRQSIRLPSRYRTTAFILLAAVVLGAAASVGAILGIFPYNLDPAPFAAVVVQVVVYFTLCMPSSAEMLLSSRETIFEQTQNPMFILNKNREIIDLNIRAREVVEGLELKVTRVFPYESFWDRWMSKDTIRVLKEDSSIFSEEADHKTVHYQEVVSSLCNHKGEEIGTFIEIKNITPIMSMIHKLQDSAYFDNLTGLHNRNYFVKMVNDWDEDQEMYQSLFPIGIIVGDVNGLKKINDTFGHARGDLLLQWMAEDLSRYRPDKAMVFRMGGDEFLTLVPKADREELNHYIEVIKSQDYGKADPDLAGASMAISYVIKEDMQTSLMESIHEADVLMYTQKYDRRQ